MVSNTRQFLTGLPANNALLWGSRGTGKSSLVKALLNKFAPEGLRVIQVEKEDLIYLSEIFNAVENEPYRFILLCDDLTFEVGELSYKMLKSALDGSVYSAPENVLIYVTSNRRHLLPDYDSDLIGGKFVNGELQQSEAMEEKVSLSDRFGLWIAFHAFSQDRYLDAVRLCVEREARERQRGDPLDQGAGTGRHPVVPRQEQALRPDRLPVLQELGRPLPSSQAGCLTLQTLRNKRRGKICNEPFPLLIFSSCSATSLLHFPQLILAPDISGYPVSSFKQRRLPIVAMHGAD